MPKPPLREINYFEVINEAKPVFGSWIRPWTAARGAGSGAFSETPQMAMPVARAVMHVENPLSRNKLL